MRYFRAPVQVLDAMRAQTMAALGQPNQYADEPWRPGGMFADEHGRGYLAFGQHHYESEPFATLLAQALLVPGVEEIDAAEFLARRPQPENQ